MAESGKQEERNEGFVEEDVQDAEPRETRANDKKKEQIDALAENVKSLAIAILLALFLREFLFAAYKIPSGSMIPTLEIGDHLIVNKIKYGLKLPFAEDKLWFGARPERGDIMVFRYPVDPRIDYIKRIIGLPGDQIEIQGNDLFVNGRKVERKDLGAEESPEGRKLRYLETTGDHRYIVQYDSEKIAFDGFGQKQWVVPEGHFFAMGDNRDNSYDSRGWGFVPENNLVGSPIFIHLSLNENWIPRFDRMFTIVD